MCVYGTRPEHCLNIRGDAHYSLIEHIPAECLDEPLKEPETAAVGVAAVLSYSRSNGAARVVFAAAGSLLSLSCRFFFFFLPFIITADASASHPAWLLLYMN